MTILLFLLVMVWFSLFFYIIDFAILSFLPLLFLLILFLFNISYVNRDSIQENYMNENNILKLSWVSILFGAGFLMFLMEFAILDITIYLFIGNIVLRFFSYFAKYKDGEDIFEIWVFLTWIFYIIYNVILWGSFFENLSYFLLICSWIYALLFFVMKIWYDVKNRYWYNFVLFALLSIFCFSWLLIDIKYLAVSIMWIILLSCVLLTRYVLWFKTKNIKKDITARDILKWERVLDFHKKQNTQDISPNILNFVYSVPDWLKMVLEVLNWSLLILLLYIFIENNITINSINEIVMFIIIVLCFVSNIFVLKSINYNSTLQKVFLFGGLNILVYIIIFATLHDSLSEILFFLVLWNFVSGICFVFSENSGISKLLKKSDYLIWFSCDVIFCLLNVVVIIYLDISIKTKIALILLYIWFRGIVFIYQKKHFQELWLNEESIWLS